MHHRTKMQAAGALLLCAAAAAGAGAAPRTGEGTPRVEVLEPVVDVGAIERGKLAEARYTLANRGDATLRITRVKPG